MAYEVSQNAGFSKNSDFSTDRRNNAQAAVPQRSRGLSIHDRQVDRKSELSAQFEAPDNFFSSGEAANGLACSSNKRTSLKANFLLRRRAKQWFIGFDAQDDLEVTSFVKQHYPDFETRFIDQKHDEWQPGSHFP